MRGEIRAVMYFGTFILILLAYYAWCLNSAGGTLNNHDVFNYGDLAEGFYHGHLSTLTEPDAVMKSAPDPYNPIYTNGHLMWDYSYYHGKYYLYYGAPPVLFLFLPYRFLTGQVMGQPLAEFIISAINLIIFAIGLRALVRLEFPRFPFWMQAGFFIIYGVSNVMSYTICQSDMYSIAVLSASTCLLTSLLAVLFAVHLPRARLFWFGVSGGAWAMAVACRATYIFAGFLFIAIALYQWWPRFRQEERPRVIREAIAWLIPAGAVLLVVGWYNWARFDSPFEFGIRYCVAGTDYARIPSFSIYYLADRLYEWTVMPFQLSNCFPYIDPSVRSQNLFYSDRIAYEHFTGIIPSFPLLVVGLFWFANVRRLAEPEQRRRLLAYGTCISAGLVGVAAPFLVYSAVTFRYLMDVDTPLYLLTALSLMARCERSPLRKWEWVVLGVIALITLYCGFAYSLIGDPCWIWHRDIDVWHVTRISSE
jgi:hypothetical protein